MQAQYQAVITKYQLKHVDFDLEGGGVGNASMRNTAIANLQRSNPGLTVSYTLQMEPTGLTDAAVGIIKDAISQGVKIAQVNGMAMDFGGSFDNGGDMLLSAERCAAAIMFQLQSLLPNATHAQIAAMTGVTVMIGTNDLQSEVFKISQIGPWVSFARQQGLGLISIWSATRDFQCTGPTSPAQGDCSSVPQSSQQYSQGLRAFNP